MSDGSEFGMTLIERLVLRWLNGLVLGHLFSHLAPSFFTRREQIAHLEVGTSVPQARRPQYQACEFLKIFWENLEKIS